MLSVRNLHYRFGSRPLFRELSFDIRQGEYVGLIGPNGVGKTTLLRCILRILSDWTGSIEYGGVSVRNIRRKQLARKIAYVQQSLSTVFAFTVRQAVEMGRYPHLSPLAPLSRDDRNIVEESLEAMGVRHFSERMIDSLSGGERQKVLLAAALAQEPDLLLLDEPTTFLDYRHQEEICHYLRRINRERKLTILEITHDLNRAALDCSHIIALADGQVVFDGPPDSLMSPERLRTIFGIDFALAQHPRLGTNMILPRV